MAETDSPLHFPNLIRIHEFGMSESLCIEHLQQLGLLPRALVCPRCGGDLWLRRRQLSQFWRCGRRCTYELPLRHFTWFSKSNFSFATVFKLTYLVINNFERPIIAHELKLHRESLTVWLDYIQQVIEDWVNHEYPSTGGSGKIVQVAGSNFVTGCRYNQHIIGGIQKDNGHVFFIPVNKCSRKDFLLVIKQNILPGSTIVIDDPKLMKLLTKRDKIYYNIKSPEDIKESDDDKDTNSIKSAFEDIRKFMPFRLIRKRLIQYFTHYMFLKSCKIHNKCSFTIFWNFMGRTRLTYEESLLAES